MQHILTQLRKNAKRNIALVLALLMLLSLVPYGYAEELQNPSAAQQTEKTDPVPTEPEEPEIAPTPIAPAGTKEPAATEIAPTPTASVSATEPKAADSAPAPMETEAAAETAEQENTAPEENKGELTFCQQLQAKQTLKEVFDAMMGDPDAMYALNAEELTALKEHTQALYDAIEEPVQDDEEYLELILDTLVMLEEQKLEVEMLDDTVTIVRNGSRILVEKGTVLG